MSTLYLIHRGRPEPPEGRTRPGLNHRIGVSSEPLSEELIAARVEIECLQQTNRRLERLVAELLLKNQALRFQSHYPRVGDAQAKDIH